MSNRDLVARYVPVKWKKIKFNNGKHEISKGYKRLADALIRRRKMKKT